MDDDIGFSFKFPALERGTGTALQGAQNFGLETRGLGRFIQQLCLLTRKSAIKISLLSEINTKIDENTKIKKSYSIIFVGIQYVFENHVALPELLIRIHFLLFFLSMRILSRIRIQPKNFSFAKNYLTRVNPNKCFQFLEI